MSKLKKINYKGNIHNLTKNKCIICEENNNLIVLHKSRRQTHSLCEMCVKGYLVPELIKNTNKLRLNIKNNISYIKCPGTIFGKHRNMCRKHFNIRDLKIDSNSELSTLILRILFVMDNPSYLICVNKNCGNIIETNLFSTDFRVICDFCNTNWCKNCNVSPYHENLTCLEYEFENNKNNVNIKYIIELKNKKKLKFCPTCKTPVIKNDGCNKMVCEICKTKWCWLCNEINIDYSHYNPNNNKKCANKLWVK